MQPRKSSLGNCYRIGRHMPVLLDYPRNQVGWSIRVPSTS